MPWRWSELGADRQQKGKKKKSEKGGPREGERERGEETGETKIASEKKGDDLRQNVIYKWERERERERANELYISHIL